MSIVVVGSANTDMVVNVERIPQQGETILGHGFSTHQGGKGANQAVSAARIGESVSFIACIGNDDFGQRALTSYLKEGINTEHIHQTGESSGVALIVVNENGKNAIAVSPEANALLQPKHLDAAEDTLASADIVLAQLETPLDTIVHLANMVANYPNTCFILNPAPAQALPEGLLHQVDIITPNEYEASVLTGIEITDEQSAREAAITLKQKGIKTVIITLGEQGAYLLDDQHDTLIPSFLVNAVDTTAAGDVFNGALACALMKKRNMLDAVRYACAASALAVQKPGAQRSAPKKEAIDALLSDLSPRNRKDKTHS